MLGVGVNEGFCFLGFLSFFPSWSDCGVSCNDKRLMYWSDMSI